jgi:hypothetical protein
MPPMVDDGKLGITKCGRREKLIFMDCVNGIIKSNSSGEVILRLQKFSAVQVTPRLNLMTSCFHNMLGHVFVTSNDTLVKMVQCYMFGPCRVQGTATIDTKV